MLAGSYGGIWWLVPWINIVPLYTANYPFALFGV